MTGPFTPREQAKIAALEAAGCQVWQVGPDNAAGLAEHLSRAGFEARTAPNHDGTRLLGLIVNGVPAHNGEVVILRPGGRISICTTAAMRPPSPAPVAVQRPAELQSQEQMPA